MQEASAERVAIARIEALLDRYGVIAPPMIDKERLDGGFSAVSGAQTHGRAWRIDARHVRQRMRCRTVRVASDRGCAAGMRGGTLRGRVGRHRPRQPVRKRHRMATNDRRVFDQAGTALRRIGRARADDCWHTRCPEAIICCSRRMRIPHCSRPRNELAYALQRNLRDGGIRGVSPSVMPTTSH